jgi:hypothetical protein
VGNEELDLMEGSASSRVENQGLDIVEGSAPTKTEEKPTISVSARRSGYVRAPATSGVMAHLGKGKKEEKLLIVLRIWINLNLIREPLGTNWPQGRNTGSS